MYRDRYEQCPRCRIDLVSAGSVRMCTQCSGHWVDGDVLREMAEAMLVPPRPVAIELVSDRHPLLPCPTCEQPMETWRLQDVPIDRCPGHGLWFDRAELQTVLYATGRGNRSAAATADDIDLAIDFRDVLEPEPGVPRPTRRPALAQPTDIETEIDALSTLLKREL